MKKLPQIIQGGMGVAVSSWQLARAVSRLGQLGVVSGVAIEVVHARRLNDGDPGGHLRRAYERFPFAGVVERVLRRYFRPEGRSEDKPYRMVPQHRLKPSRALIELVVLSNFAEVYLAKEGHDGLVGINYLEKVQMPLLYGFYGAMLAGVDAVLMGAGIPKEAPKVLDSLAAGRPATYRIAVVGAESGEVTECRFDPVSFFGAAESDSLDRPDFLAIVSSNTLANFLAKNPDSRPDGYIIEGPAAGGHNAPPRGPLHLDETGQPVYGPRDVVDIEALIKIGLPFWLAGEYGSPERLTEALDDGAAGIQVGSAFALCAESGIDSKLKTEITQRILDGSVEVTTDPLASPSGYPFKVVDLEGTISDPEIYQARDRICDLGFLRSAYRTPDGDIGYRCPAEPVDVYLKKGGTLDETEGRLCLCNALLATVDLGQVRKGVFEPPIVTAGDDLERVARVLIGPDGTYTAADVIEYLLGRPVGASS